MSKQNGPVRLSPYELVLSKLSGVRRISATRAVALCPAHNDHKASLRIDDDERCVRFTCWPCGGGKLATTAILRAVGLQLSDLYAHDKDDADLRDIAPWTPAMWLQEQIEVMQVLSDESVEGYAKVYPPDHTDLHLAQLRRLAAPYYTAEQVSQIATLEKWADQHLDMGPPEPRTPDVTAPREVYDRSIDSWMARR